MATSAALVSRRRKPPRSINTFGFSPTGGQPSSAMRSRAKLKMIEKADENEAPLRGASLLMCDALSWLGMLYRRSGQDRQREFEMPRRSGISFYTASHLSADPAKPSPL